MRASGEEDAPVWRPHDVPGDVPQGDGDGWVTLPDGSRRWGRYGAAGLLLYAADAAGRGQVLLQHRAWWSHQGDTWGMPGGALNSGESSVQGAVREFGEEVEGDLGRVCLDGVHRQDHVVWHYDTVLGRLPEPGEFSPGNSESAAIRWVPVEEVASLPLLPAFGVIWPQVRRALTRRPLLIVPATELVRLLPDGRAGDPRSPVERLRDGLATLAAAGLSGADLPPELDLVPLHRWFPTIALVTGEGGPRLAPAPGVEVVADVATLAERHARSGWTPVPVTSDRGFAERCAGAAVAPPSWLLGLLGGPETDPRAGGAG
ncbi:NUDIX hydrolase [Marinactinospora thermotolerans]|uniref:ADP-ribose pyrophosphatase YjhB, NUDIX family n=1 Tax=Marinactinospora thermotolerans DSM 45154 TaxID=1122192 RepID=A0A1T4T3I6_9ACTN|nr:NUDIX hydrolase [Marinactinospora thermotolerans]SKA34718.1 ADP-ribose pyrophosphatase YjhB, NUDIX family [Marinactinospora thermotolerans DSM 45154]